MSTWEAKLSLVTPAVTPHYSGTSKREHTHAVAPRALHHPLGEAKLVWAAICGNFICESLEERGVDGARANTQLIFVPFISTMHLVSHASRWLRATDEENAGEHTRIHRGRQLAMV